MSKNKQLRLVDDVDERILPVEKTIFFGRISDITLLPDWFKEDEELNPERFKARWRFISGRFPEEGLGLNPNQHTKVFLSTDEKRTLYAELKEIKVVISRLGAGLGKLVLCDGYPKDVIDGFGWNIVRSVQLKQTSSTELLDRAEYTLYNFSKPETIIISDYVVATSDAQKYNDIENCKVAVRDKAKDKGWLFVDMTRPDWVKIYFPELEYLISAQEQFMLRRDPRYSPLPVDSGSYGGGEPPIDGGGLLN